MSDAHVKTIQAIYAAFGRGDVPAVLEHLAEGATFSFNAAKSDVPWHATFRGKREIPKFFEAVAAGTTIHAFAPLAFTAGDSHVAVSIRFEHTIKKSGRRITEEQVHWWTFDAHGRVEKLVHYADTAAVNDAYRG